MTGYDVNNKLYKCIKNFFYTLFYKFTYNHNSSLILPSHHRKQSCAILFNTNTLMRRGRLVCGFCPTSCKPCNLCLSAYTM